MKLLPMIDLLKDAVKGGYSIAAINVSNMETIKALLHASEELNQPLVLQFSPIQGRIQQVSYKEIVGMARLFGQNKDAVIAIHLDHSETVEDCKEAIEAGFTSVMYDGSKADYETNAANSREVVMFARQYGVTVEAELGVVGGAEGIESKDKKCFMTDSSLAEDFVQRTGIDCLAVSIGNAHGEYTMEPDLDFNLLKDIYQKVKLPLVLHGGTGISEADLRRAINSGIKKINFFTEIDRAYVHSFVDSYHQNNKVYMMAAQENGRQAFYEEAVKKMKVCANR